MSRWPVAYLIFLRAAVVHEESFLLPYRYESYFIPIEEVPRTFWVVSKYISYAWDSQATKP